MGLLGQKVILRSRETAATSSLSRAFREVPARLRGGDPTLRHPPDLARPIAPSGLEIDLGYLFRR